jgi:hypothetical protein
MDLKISSIPPEKSAKAASSRGVTLSGRMVLFAVLPQERRRRPVFVRRIQGQRFVRKAISSIA